MDAWDRRIARADALARTDAASGALLAFYATLLRTQRQIAQRLARQPLTGVIDEDAPLLRALLPLLLRTVEDHGPPPLAAAARELARAADEALDELLRDQWREPLDTAFFAKALLQPYAAQLAAAGWRPERRAEGTSCHRCPRCGGPPQLAILTNPPPLSPAATVAVSAHTLGMPHTAATPQPAGTPHALDAPAHRGTPPSAATPDATGSSGGRLLLCATCLDSWPSRRILCAHCGEEEEYRLAYYQAPAQTFAHARVDACDTCRHYLKSIDLTRLGFAVPLVDEVAAAPLDVWARAHGYTKIALNLVGL